MTASHRNDFCQNDIYDTEQQLWYISCLLSNRRAIHIDYRSGLLRHLVNRNENIKSIFFGTPEAPNSIGRNTSTFHSWARKLIKLTNVFDKKSFKRTALHYKSITGLISVFDSNLFVMEILTMVTEYITCIERKVRLLRVG